MVNQAHIQTQITKAFAAAGLDLDAPGGVAVSGGRDSVALLDALRLARRSHAEPLHVLHVNYKTRQEESDEDEDFVRNLAQSYGMEFHGTIAPEFSAGNFQDEARRFRYRFFEEIKSGRRLAWIATAHHLDDQIETIIGKLSRGVSPEGLCGFSAFDSTGIIRPLIRVSSRSVIAFTNERNLVWREDRSNNESTYLRNRIRMQVVPALKEENPELDAAFGRFLEILEGENQYLASETETALAQHGTTGQNAQGVTLSFPAESFLAYPVALQRRILQRIAQCVTRSEWQIPFERVEEMRRVVMRGAGNRTVQFHGPFEIHLKDKTIHAYNTEKTK
jgi:tRNA(Ile)-lysidine synthase